MLKINNLKEEDKGKWVEYIGNVGEKEQGKIKGWNDNWVFVVYKCDNQWDRYYDFTGVATDPKQLNYV